MFELKLTDKNGEEYGIIGKLLGTNNGVDYHVGDKISVDGCLYFVYEYNNKPIIQNMLKLGYNTGSFVKYKTFNGLKKGDKIRVQARYTIDELYVVENNPKIFKCPTA